MMQEVSVSAKIEGEEKREAKFQYDIPKNLEEALQNYTEEQVFGEFLSGFTVSLQAPARKKLRSMPAGLSVEAYSDGVQSVMSDWKLGQKTVRTTSKPEDLVNSLLAQWGTLSKERQKAILSQFAQNGLDGTTFMDAMSEESEEIENSDDENEEEEENSSNDVEYSPRNARRGR